MIMDQDSAFMSTLMNYLFKRLSIKIKTVGPYNHQSLQVEQWDQVSVYYFDKTPHGSRTKLEQTPVFSYICIQHINTPNLCNHSPFELIFGRQPRILLDLETDPNIKVSGTYRDYCTLLNKRLHYLQNVLQNLKTK